MVKLEVGLHQGCFIREQEVSRGGEASDGASPPKIQKDKMTKLYHRRSKKCEASVELTIKTPTPM